MLADILIHTNFTLFYKGSHSENPSINSVTIAENNLESYIKKALVKKLSYIIIEAVQTFIERYSYQTNEQEDFSLIFSDNTTFHVITENLIENKNVEQLKPVGFCECETRGGTERILPTTSQFR